MTRLTLRQKFRMGMVTVVAVALLVLLGSRYLSKSAGFHYLERQHLALVMQIKLGAEQAAIPGAPAVSKAAMLQAVEDALKLASRVEVELFPIERELFRLMGFGELVSLPYEDIEDLKRMRFVLQGDPGETLTPALVARLRPTLATIERNSERFAPLTAEAVAFVKNVVFAVNIVGTLALLAAFLAIRQAVLPPLDEAVGVARRIARGDLTGAVPGQGHDEVGRLMQALGEMQGSLGGMVEQLRRSSQRLESASADIARGNADLGARTGQQAAALEETAAAMEELGSAVQQNAGTARQAAELAAGASTVAASGGEVVGRVAETMKGIASASRDISEITGLIDSIAFQTNILALNAAVEAARAGEQGRGFAVVAGEVRTLATRSAEAARQIRELIEASAQRVAQGSVLAGEAGTTMQEVVGSIRRVSQLIEEISCAGGEQSAGVDQVGSAIGQLDRATQQNGALVGELSVAAEGLKTQAQELVQAMGVFKLQAEATRGEAAEPVLRLAPA